MGSETKLKHLTTKIGSGATPRGGQASYLETGDYRLIRSQNIYNHSFEWNGLAYISYEQAQKLNNVTVEVNDILINITGDSVARNTIATPDILPARVNQHVAIVRCDPTLLDPHYLSAYLTSKRMQQNLLSIAQTGGTRAALTKGMLENLNIPLVSIEEQRSIGNMMKRLNDKIRNNEEIILNLEQLAQTLFKRWFVDFEFPNENGEPYKSSDGEMVESELGTIPNGWSIRKLKDAVKLQYGKNMPKNNLDEKGFPVFGANGVIGFTKDYMFKDPQVILTCRGSGSGDIFKTDPQAFITNNSLILEDTNSLGVDFIRFVVAQNNPYNYRTGSAQPQITINNIGELKILIPSIEILRRFKDLTIGISETQFNKKMEIKMFEELRNTLLPKLLSGEIELPDENEVKEIVPVS